MWRQKADFRIHLRLLWTMVVGIKQNFGAEVHIHPIYFDLFIQPTTYLFVSDIVRVSQTIVLLT